MRWAPILPSLRYTPGHPRESEHTCSTPRNRGKNTTLLSSMSAEGMGPSLAIEGSTNKVLFETYIERVLCPSLTKTDR